MSLHATRGRFARVSAVVVIVSCLASRGRAAEEAPATVQPGEPIALGRVWDPGPAARALWLTAAAGYGYTGAVLGQGDRHDRAAARLTADVRPWSWLAFTLRLDGRYDHHTLPGQPSDDGYVGDPRVEVRAERVLAPGLRGGVRLGLWLPGARAPSLKANALSPELTGALGYAWSDLPLAIDLNAGYRLDRSSHTADDRARLSASDRLALGLNGFDAVLVGLGARLGRGRVQGFVEGHAELLLGSGRPAISRSPMFLDAGVRAALDERWRLEAALEVSPSERPDLGPTAPLVAVPPRFAAWLGVAARFDVFAPPPPPPRPVAPAPPPPPPAPVPPPTAEDEDAKVAKGRSGQLRVLVRSYRGSGLAAEVSLRRVGAGGKLADELAAQGTGTRQVMDVRPGTYQVEISAPGYEAQRRKIQIEDDGVTLLNVELRRER